MSHDEETTKGMHYPMTSLMTDEQHDEVLLEIRTLAARLANPLLDPEEKENIMDTYNKKCKQIRQDNITRLGLRDWWIGIAKEKRAMKG